MAIEGWFEIVVRQLILYSLPLIISLSVVSWVEARVLGKRLPHPFYALAWRGSGLPFIAALCMQRGVIVALARPLATGIRAASIRLITHLFLMLLGLLLYSWSLAHQPPTGLPPLHLWWAKVLMFFNLCMAVTHLLPLPSLLCGELLLSQPRFRWIGSIRHVSVAVVTLLAVTPVLDLLLGGKLIYPIYAELSAIAAHWAN